MYAYFEEEREKTKSLNAAAKKESVPSSCDRLLCISADQTLTHQHPTGSRRLETSRKRSISTASSTVEKRRLETSESSPLVCSEDEETTLRRERSSSDFDRRTSRSTWARRPPSRLLTSLDSGSRCVNILTEPR